MGTEASRQEHFTKAALWMVLFLTQKVLRPLSATEVWVSMYIHYRELGNCDLALLIIIDGTSVSPTARPSLLRPPCPSETCTVTTTAFHHPPTPHFPSVPDLGLVRSEPPKLPSHCLIFLKRRFCSLWTMVLLRH